MLERFKNTISAFVPSIIGQENEEVGVSRDQHSIMPSSSTLDPRISHDTQRTSPPVPYPPPRVASVPTTSSSPHRPSRNDRTMLSSRELLGKLQQENGQLLAKSEETEKLLQNALSDRDDARQKLEDAYGKVLELQQKLADNEELSNSRATELKASRTFIPGVDKLSAVDVASLVEGLNAQILQTAATIAEIAADDIIIGAGRDAIADIWWNLPSYQQLRADAYTLVGEPILYATLKLRPKTADGAQALDLSGLVQYTLQACLVNLCMRTVRAWGLPDASSVDDSLDQIYQNLQETEYRGVPRRWKAITLGGIRRITAHCGLQTVTNSFVQQMITVLSFMRWPAPFIPDALFTDRITNVVEQTLKVKKAITEEFTSAELLLSAPQPIERFDPNFMGMTCTEGDREISSGMVLVTTDMGLIMAGDGDSCKYLVKPKVLLDRDICL